MTNILNIFETQGVAPTYFKTAAIIKRLIPKNSSVTYLNDCCPFALTHIKFLVRLVMAHIHPYIPSTLNPQQYAYWKKKMLLTNLFCHPPKFLSHEHLSKNAMHHFIFLSIHITDHLPESLNTSLLGKKAQRCFYFLRKIKKLRLHTPILNCL